VVLYDITPELAAKGLERITATLEKGVAKKKVEPAMRDAALAKIRTTGDLADAVADADMVIEAAPEKLELKRSIFESLSKICKPEAILASNTSSLEIGKIAAAATRPERVLGLHFFNPVHIMRLIELVRGLETSDETLQTMREVADRMGKEVVLVNESPGFVTSRINALIGNEAFRMLEAGVASAEDIDTALKLGLNHPMGPFEMVDLVGLDTRLSILKFLHQTLGEKYRPCPLLEQYVRAGRLGRKTGKGVYDYSKKIGLQV